MTAGLQPVRKAWNSCFKKRGIKTALIVIHISIHDPSFNHLRKCGHPHEKTSTESFLSFKSPSTLEWFYSMSNTSAKQCWNTIPITIPIVFQKTISRNTWLCWNTILSWNTILGCDSVSTWLEYYLSILMVEVRAWVSPIHCVCCEISFNFRWPPSFLWVIIWNYNTWRWFPVYDVMRCVVVHGVILLQVLFSSMQLLQEIIFVFWLYHSASGMSWWGRMSPNYMPTWYHIWRPTVASR